MNVDVTDYLTECEMKNIAAEAFTKHCAQIFRDDHDRIFSNAAYHIVRKMVDEAFDGSALDTVAAKAKGVISQMSEYTVFGARGVYDKDDTEGRKAINAAVFKHRDRIENRVAKLIDGISRADVLEAIAESEMSFTLARAQPPRGVSAPLRMETTNGKYNGKPPPPDRPSPRLD